MRSESARIGCTIEGVNTGFLLTYAKPPKSSCHIPVTCCELPYQHYSAYEERGYDNLKLDPRAAETILD